MMRRLTAVAGAFGLAFGMLLGVAAPAMAEPHVSPVQCLIGGGLPVPLSEDDQNLVCLGGAYNGHTVTAPESSQPM